MVLILRVPVMGGGSKQLRRLLKEQRRTSDVARGDEGVKH